MRRKWDKNEIKILKNFEYLNALKDEFWDQKLWRKKLHIQSKDDFSRKQHPRDGEVYEIEDGLWWWKFWNIRHRQKVFRLCAFSEKNQKDFLVFIEILRSFEVLRELKKK